MHNSEAIWRHVEEHAAALVALSDRVWEMPELNFQEVRSAAEHTAMLRAQGFRVTEGIGGIPTAMMGEAGEGGPVIAILGEYDALPGLSQEAGVAEHRPRPGEGAGHGCGHNLLGAGALLAATAVKDWLAAEGRPGRVRYYGCPAEEGGAAKTFMVRDGVFSDVDVAITWHPGPFVSIWEPVSLAIQLLDFTFAGKASHAAAAPHLGRSALDAVELMNVGVNYLREHMPSDARVHYAYLDAGGIAPNVVQAGATVRYLVRAADLPGLLDLAARVEKIARGAALMTETQVASRVVSAMSNLLANPPLEQALHANLTRLGPPPFDAEDRAFAEAIRATLTREDIVSAHRRFGVPVTDAPLCDTIVPLGAKGERMMGSTDVGDVSWAVPTVQARGATYAIGTPGHSWQMTAQGKTPAAHKGMIHVAKAMAGTAVDVLRDPDLLARAKADHAERLARTPYVSPLPAGLAPPLDMAG
ncbi:M20 family metallopeptidase [Methylobacterium frigidaeris]|uniref:p-aminobenzoyl-glutamate hydrolase subunit B n=1 Tax=Methylobacterium frigidaeris TaxID=2038277 RepID=A0AA37M389_9HYPH|nr:M20 family metallopeptidase [Methylobacterium frigidaeris]PIK68729.1 amidohydrolase [Methylobacterium frigidaeris]GJD61147.1 p-aminobenzoyl-glutamate hydrolase subunit B [Methylobacterium frigidaeris]